MSNMKVFLKLFITTQVVVFFNIPVYALDLEKIVEDTKKTINQLNQNKNSKNTEQTNSISKTELKSQEEVQKDITLSKENDKGFVLGIQFNLNRTGYKVGFPDGIYNDKTRLAIEEFEKDRGLTVTGKPTELLAENLKKAVDEGYKKQNNKNNTSTASQSKSVTNTGQQTNSQKPQIGKSEHVQIKENKDGVKHIQTRLKQMEYYKGDINGEYDKDTYMAVKSFQVQRKLKNVGYLNFALIDELDKAYKEGHTINSEKEKYADWKPCNKLPKNDDEEICYPFALATMMSRLEYMGYVGKFPHDYMKKGLHEKHRAAINQFQKDRGMEVDGRATKRLGNEIEAAYAEYKKKKSEKYEAEQKIQKHNIKPCDETCKTCMDLGTGEGPRCLD